MLKLFFARPCFIFSSHRQSCAGDAFLSQITSKNKRSEVHVQHDGLRVLSVEVQELRSALRRLAAHVMWHNGAVVGSQKEPATPSMKHSGGVDDSDDEEWYSDDEGEPAGEALSPRIAMHSVLTVTELSVGVSSRKVCW